MEGQLNLWWATKFRLWMTRHWVNCRHKLNINEIKARKNSLSCLTKVEEGTKLNVTFYWVNFDQKLTARAGNFIQTESKPDNSHNGLIEVKRKNIWIKLVQQDSMRFLLTLRKSLLQWCKTGTYCMWNYCTKFIFYDKKIV